MNFPKFWARGVVGGFSSWRWSDSSVEEAERLATVAASRMAEIFRTQGRHSVDRYAYADRPLREPVLQEFHDDFGETSAVISRNSYGCQILNASRTLFVDIDEAEENARKGFLGSLFAKKTSTLEQAIGKAKVWAASDPQWNWRIYKTRAGVRLLATQRMFLPNDPLCQAVFDATGADPLYRQLCQTQQCFRARLTPKPWRCDAGLPPARWPFLSAEDEREFQSWESQYRDKSKQFATCEFVTDIGSGEVHRTIRPLIDLHDEMTRATSGHPLA